MRLGYRGIAICLFLVVAVVCFSFIGEDEKNFYRGLIALLMMLVMLLVKFTSDYCVKRSKTKSNHDS